MTPNDIGTFVVSIKRSLRIGMFSSQQFARRLFQDGVPLGMLLKTRRLGKMGKWDNYG